MITQICGIVTQNATTLTVHVGNADYGIGYEIIVSDPSQYESRTTILVRHIITENSQILYGFPDEETRELFDLLTKYVSGIGPKTAHNIVGKVSVQRFKQAVAENDLASLSKIKGIGGKTAERILVELRDKVKVADLWKNNPSEDKPIQETTLALMALGFTRTNAEKSAKDARKSLPDCQDTRELTRIALRQ